MLRKLVVLFSFVALVAASAPASANTEPTAYDTRSIALGLTGVSYLERPAAIALNPALLEGIEKFGFTILINPLFVNTKAPVSGPNTSVSTFAVGPMGSIFLAGRIAPRVVFGFGIYIEQGYGASFDNVANVDGALPGSGQTEPENLSVLFFNGEAALASSIRITDKVNIGIALRLPFARQDADLYQNVGAALDTVAYGRVKNQLSGVGFPSPRIGISYKPIENLSLGIMWRAYSKLKLTGTTSTTGVQGLPFPDIENAPAQADWVVPNALQFGAALTLLEKKLLLVVELRLQFHDAKKQGNEDQTVTVDVPIFGPIDAVAPFNWKNIWSLKLGVEYQFSELFALRGGFNAAVSNIREAYAQYFTPPPGFSPAAMLGAGFNWDRVMLDIGTLISWGNTDIGAGVSEPGQTIPVGGEDVQVCSAEQVVRTGCAGNYRTRSYWASLTFTYMY